MRKVDSCCGVVLVDESAEAIAALDAGRGRWDREQVRRGRRWPQAQRAVGPVRVVVIEEDAENMLEMAPVYDQEAVEAFGAGGADEALSERVRLRKRNDSGRS